MLYEFSSRATGRVTMLAPVAERILAILDRAPAAQGIFTVAQLPAAIAALERAIADERRGGNAATAREADTGDDDTEPAARVTLAQRAFPLLELMKAAHAAERDVTWGL